MLTAYVRAFGQAFDARIVRLIGFSVLLSLLVLGGLWTGIAWLLSNSSLTSMPVVDKVLDWLGGIATIVLAFFLFPVAISACLGLLLDAVARAVEARHYPDLPPAKGIGLVAGAFATVRFLAKALVLNLLLLLVFAIAAPLYPFAWFAAHAYLLGREYFELVSLRRLDVPATRVLRARHPLSLIGGGLVAIGLFAIPVVNLIAPVIVTMAMVHAVERWRHVVATN